MEQPILSAKLGVLGKKESFRLNQLLYHQKSVSGPNYNQAQYPIIDLMFTLVISGKLYFRTSDRKGKPVLNATPVMESFRKLNPYEQYVYLLQIYWTSYEFEDKFARWTNKIEFYHLFTAIATASPDQRMVKTARSPYPSVFAENAAIFHHLTFFGLGEVELLDGATASYEDSIGAFVPNKLGIGVYRVLIADALPIWNIEMMPFLLSILKIPTGSIRKKEPFEVFRSIFPQGNVQETVLKEKVADSKGVYTFKVALAKNVWRKIKMAHNHSLHDLHTAIQQAFDFNDDHLYAFYIGGNQRTGKPVNGPDAGDGEPTAETVRLAELGMYQNQKLTYLFDFGDEWLFDITLMEIDNNAPMPLRPEITETKGESPEQYPEY